MIKSMIVAISENNVIGKNNEIPWRLSADMKRFKAVTMGHHVIMGRKTFESIIFLHGKPLPGRPHIILTRDKCYSVPDGCITASSLKDAFDIADQEGEVEVFIVGGGEVYKEALSVCDRIYLTKVKCVCVADYADTFLDLKLSKFEWDQVQVMDCQKDDKNEFDYSFIQYERR